MPRELGGRGRDSNAPGGDTARWRGCLCPPIDNGRGDIELARDRGGWVIVSDCPLHGLAGTERERTEVPAQPGSSPIPSNQELCSDE
jgi:hypothetical protein